MRSQYLSVGSPCLKRKEKPIHNNYKTCIISIIIVVESNCANFMFKYMQIWWKLGYEIILCRFTLEITSATYTSDDGGTILPTSEASSNSTKIGIVDRINGFMLRSYHLFQQRSIRIYHASFVDESIFICL